MPKIQLDMSTMDVVAQMSEGNPGAATVCIHFLMDTSRIDPDNALEGLGHLLVLDELGVYGSRIWMLYKDVCGEDMVNLCGVMRARQLGIITEEALLHSIDTPSSLDIPTVVSAVRVALPNFNQED